MNVVLSANRLLLLIRKFFHPSEKSGPSLGRQSGAGARSHRCLSASAGASICDGEIGAVAGADGPPVRTRAGSALPVPSRVLKHVRLVPQPGQMAPLFGAREAVN
ncbi:hypothetical protein SKAU_G00399470 [Synaphobranchus kaupii]|uniref:Uncharacterized protein n=1 Tax=Synaphobranchus kaupii TaxID=118154 RepID=A0A9Q1E8S4_SYNKA|nr:hypothetical protein SKAU_G00399470 [Synaphobranchus kaupii]